MPLVGFEPKSQQAIGRRPTPYTAWPQEPAMCPFERDNLCHWAPITPETKTKPIFEMFWTVGNIQNTTAEYWESERCSDCCTIPLTFLSDCWKLFQRCGCNLLQSVSVTEQTAQYNILIAHRIYGVIFQRWTVYFSTGVISLSFYNLRGCKFVLVAVQTFVKPQTRWKPNHSFCQMNTNSSNYFQANVSGIAGCF
jgi:hypothetical protein